MRIAVTTFYTKSYQPLADITTTVLKQYCDKHGYYLDVNILDDNESFHFRKTKHARKLLDEYDVAMAIENDILITNFKYRIENFMNDEKVFFICKDVNNYNGGIFISTKGSKPFLNFVNTNEYNLGDEQNYFEQFCGFEPNLKYVTTKQHPAFNSIPYEYYAPSYGYINWEQYNPRKEKPTHEMGCWEKGDFCIHLPGMTLEKRIEIFQNHLKDIIYE